MALIEHKHYHVNLDTEKLLMAISEAFQAQLNRMDSLVQTAVQAQAAADAAAIAAAKQDQADELAALQAKLDALAAAPVAPAA